MENQKSVLSKLYRNKYANISSDLLPSKFPSLMAVTIGYYDGFMSIAGKATSTIAPAEIDEPEELLFKFDKQWECTAAILNIPVSLGAKFHHLYHIMEWMRIWGVPIGYLSEQSIEGFHQTYNNVHRRYTNQRGILGLKYAVHQLMLITSPTYQS